ncbi:DUF262 domain-containing protein [Helicobacter ailurogastricus]|uniref:DUF262 domain-containing protein n=1 Tax=Helicobacter ailurogastricus TaxID=1578720 RepID=UPI000CF1670B|nr:DUF262 domain-containing protein [Helicobacter ailurogastricus]
MQTDGFCPIREDGLCPVKALERRNFKIPAYQRGYRWTAKEVQLLLKDIVRFIQKGKSEEFSEEFYSLQPIVVKKMKEEGKEIYHVIDGQQRLTTIFLIIKYFEGRDLFTLHYETREGSFQFLQNIQDPSTYPPKINIDFYHFKEAYRAIKDYIEKKEKGFFGTQKQKFLETLYDKCKLLWHESEDDEKEVFVRLNSGKIPLMEAEKIKALFLAKRDGLQEKEIENMAKKWYGAEKKAREERDFIYCVLERVEAKDIMEIIEVVGDKQYRKPVLLDDIQRITAYLKAIVPHKNKEDYLFAYFDKQYENESMDDEWDNLEEAMATLSGFASKKGNDFIEREIFHHFGFLIYTGDRIHDLHQQWLKHEDEKEFAKYLFARVKEKVQASLKDKSLEDLTYNDGKQRPTIQNILLLFNLAHLISDQSSNAYFQFNRFVLEQWSLEHIYAQNSRSVCPTTDKAAMEENQGEIKEWLEEVMKYLEDDKLKKKIITSRKKMGKGGMDCYRV